MRAKSSVKKSQEADNQFFYQKILTLGGTVWLALQTKNNISEEDVFNMFAQTFSIAEKMTCEAKHGSSGLRVKQPLLFENSHFSCLYSRSDA